MTTQQILRKRLTSARNILHITQAMELVAGVRFRKLATKMEHFRFYANKLSEMIEDLKLSTHADHPLFQQRPVQNIRVILIGSDKGLCGSYNANLIKESQKFLNRFSPDQISLILIGNKIIDHFKKESWKIEKQISDLAHKLTENDVAALSRELAAGFIQGEFDELWVLYTHFKNVMVKIPQLEKVLPLKNVSASQTRSPINFIFEPTPEMIYTNLIPRFFYTKLHALLFESHASELASRMIAMKAATKNAEEMIDKLTLIKNKNRQFNITREILEITAGAEGIK